MARNPVVGVILAVAGAAGMVAWLNSDPDKVGGGVVLSAATQKFTDTGVPPPLKGQTDEQVKVTITSPALKSTLPNPCDQKQVKHLVADIKNSVDGSNNGKSAFDRFLSSATAVRAITRLESGDLSDCFSSGSQDKSRLMVSLRSDAILAMRERIDVSRVPGSLQDRFQASEDMDRILFLVKMSGQKNFSEKDLLWELGYNKTSNPLAEYAEERRKTLTAISDTAIEQIKQKYGFHPREMVLLNLGESAKGDTNLINAYRYLAHAIHHGAEYTDERRLLGDQLQNFFNPRSDRHNALDSKASSPS